MTAIDLTKIKLLSFDCYGTLVDWRKSVCDILEPFFNRYQAVYTREEIFQAFLDADRHLESGNFMPYREILAEIVLFMADDLKVSVDPAERYILSEKFSEWKPFPDTVESLKRLGRHYRLAIISNVDDDLFGITNTLLEVEFDYIVTAEQLGSYKPSENNFISAKQRFGLDIPEILHVAQSIYHDIIPSNKLGWNNVWVNRYNESRPGVARALPDLEVRDLSQLVDALCKRNC
jgi:2-haloacid dehalogenase